MEEGAVQSFFLIVTIISFFSRNSSASQAIVLHVARESARPFPTEGQFEVGGRLI